jgi:hypothetical protein
LSNDFTPPSAVVIFISLLISSPVLFYPPFLIFFVLMGKRQINL